MRPDLLTPSREITPGDIQDAFALIPVKVPLEAIEPWTELEMALAYDWAMREHLSASDNPVKRRDKPSFVAAVEQAAQQASEPAAETGGSAVSAWDAWLAKLRASQHPIGNDLATTILKARKEIDELRRRNTIPAPQGGRIHEAVREIITGRGEQGATLMRIRASLADRGMYPAEDIVQRWLEADARDGLIEKHSYGRWKTRPPGTALKSASAPVIPDRTHHLDLSPAETARLRAFLASPNGGWTSGRLSVDSVGGGIMVRTAPYRVDERLYGQVLDVLRGCGRTGISPAGIAAAMGEARDAIMSALRSLRAAGEAENCAFGVWRSTVKQPLHARDYEEGVGW